MPDKVLFVDDDANILSALQRQLRRRFDIDASTDPIEAVEMLKTNGPYAVVVSDMRMPGMNGIQLLARVRELAPSSVRIMLTGNTDQQTAIAAVNEGAIFRFLTKPCSSETLTAALAAAIAQHRLITAEKELLEQTLRGSVKVLTDILGLIHPIAFSRTPRIQLLVRELASILELQNVWELELAAMLSQIGCVTLIPEMLDQVYSGQELAPEVTERFAQHPTVAARLLSSIPRLEGVAAMVGQQQQPCGMTRYAPIPKDRDPITVGAQLLNVAVSFDRLLGCGLSPNDATNELLKRPDVYEPAIVRCLERVVLPGTDYEIRVVPIRDLNTRMILDEDVRARNGTLIVTHGQVVTNALLERLRNFCSHRGIAEQIRVRVPSWVVRAAPDRPGMLPVSNCTPDPAVGT